jgi:ParB family chromosome partitioning protein
MSLDQLMAFAVSPDHERQEQVWEALRRSHTKEPYYIRRLLTEGAVRASDKRAQFVGIAAYQSAGGTIMRDLFQEDHGGWLQDPVLLDRLVAEKLDREADAVRAEGWKWLEVATDLPYGHTFGLRHIPGQPVAMTQEEVTTAEALRAEYENLEHAHADADELPEEVDQRLGEIETALAALDDRPVKYDPEEIARAGAFVSIDGSGALRVERGYVRPEDQPAVPQFEPETDADSVDAAGLESVETEVSSPADREEPEEDASLKPIPDRLLTELTAYRTLALRDAPARNPDVAFSAALHALCLKLFYSYRSDSCVEIDAKSVVFGSQAPGLNDTGIVRPSTTGIAVGPTNCPRSPAICGTRCSHSMPTADTRCLRIASGSASTQCMSPGIVVRAL